MAIRIINLQPRNFHISPLLKKNYILKFQDKTCLENILFVSKSLNNLSVSVFNTWFSFSSDQVSSDLVFILSHINNSMVMQKLYMTLLVHK